MPAKGRYTPGRILSDRDHAIVKKIKQEKQKAITREWQSTVEVLDLLERFVRTFDERAAKRKGGVVRPRRPLKKKTQGK